MNALSDLVDHKLIDHIRAGKEKKEKISCGAGDRVEDSHALASIQIDDDRRS